MTITPNFTGAEGSETNHRLTFTQKVSRRWQKSLFLCVGLDPQPEKLPSLLRPMPLEIALFEFNRAIIQATASFAAAFKPNLAFYEQCGLPGLAALERTCHWLQEQYPEIPLILDAKRGDLANTNQAYARYLFDILGGDAVTVQPYLGAEALTPFLERSDKGVFVLCRTSNPESGEVQELQVTGDAGNEPLYHRIARLAVSHNWNYNGNIGLVAGATYPAELGAIRQIAPTVPLLIPGIGAQGGDLTGVIANGLNATGDGLLISASRSIIFASEGNDFAAAANRETQNLARAITEELEKVLQSR